MSTSSDTNAIIIGGGIGGLATAIALRQAGFEVTVFERAERLAPIGAGLTLWANAMQALDRLGLGDQVRDRALPALGGGIRTARGAVLVALSAAELARHGGGASVAVHRADLQQVLHAALPADVVRLGMPCTGVRQDEAHAYARFADGTEVRGRLVVGADGLHSVVRAALFGSTSPTYAGYTAWRGIAPFPHERLLPGESWGCGARFGQVALRAGQAYWFAVTNAAAGADRPPAMIKPHLLEVFAAWHAPIPELIAATAVEQIIHTDIYDRAPLQHWSGGRITLLGDAAHPMTPNLGQGGCQALEDAVVVGRCLSETPDVALALRQYEARRLARTSAIVLQARRLGQVAQWSNPLACRLRDALLRRLPARLQHKQLEEIVGYAV